MLNGDWEGGSAQGEVHVSLHLSATEGHVDGGGNFYPEGVDGPHAAFTLAGVPRGFTVTLHFSIAGGQEALLSARLTNPDRITGSLSVPGQPSRAVSLSRMYEE